MLYSKAVFKAHVDYISDELTSFPCIIAHDDVSMAGLKATGNV